MNITISTNALKTGYQMTKTHLCNQILSLSVLSAYILILGLIQKIEAILLFNSTSLLKMKKKNTADNCQEPLHLNLHSSKIIFAKRY